MTVALLQKAKACTAQHFLNIQGSLSQVSTAFHLQISGKSSHKADKSK